MQNVVLTDKRGVCFVFEGQSNDDTIQVCVVERHNMTVMLTRHTRIQPARYTIQYKTTRQKTSKAHGTNTSDFELCVKRMEIIFNSQLKAEVRRAEQRECGKKENAEFLASLKVGSILYDSWGYSMTIVDFYKVTAIKGSKVTLIELQNKYPNNDNGSLSGSQVVASDIEVGEPKEYMVRGAGVRINSRSTATLWDGKPKYENRND